MSEEVLYDIQRSLGRIEQKIDSHVLNFADHVKADELMYVAVDNLKLGSARQKGFFSALASAGTALGAGVGYLIERFTLGHH